MGKLTVRAIDSAKPQAKAYKLMDGEGLQLRVAPDGVKTWLVRYMIHGSERQYTLPKRYREKSGDGFYSLTDAREEASIIRALARQGIDYQVKIEQDRLAEDLRLAAEKIENKSVNELFDAWITDGVRRKDGNAELQRSFGKDVLPALGPIAVKRVTEHDLRKVLRKMVERGVNRSAVVVYDSLVQMFLWAEERQPWRKLLAEGNPVRLIDIEKIVSPDYDMSNERGRRLSNEEIRELHTKLKEMRLAYENAADKRIAAKPVARTTELAIWIMLSTICRVGELSMARWEHINLEKGEWFIPKENVKGNVADFMVFLSEFALERFRYLKKETGESEWCFPASNKDEGHICVKSISKQVGDRQTMFKKDRKGNPRKSMKNRTKNENALVLAGGANGAWTPHDLRRTGATLMQSLGMTMDLIDRCQNHVLAGSKVRRHYLLFEYGAEKREAWRRLGERLDLLTRDDVENVSA
jgi:integrase